MARSDRIDKKQLKEDALVTFSARALDYMKANANLFIGGILAVVIVVVLLVFWAADERSAAWTPTFAPKPRWAPSR